MNFKSGFCSFQCGTCWGFGNCSPVSTYTHYKVDAYGGVKGRNSMMGEIYTHGPLACCVHATEQLEQFEGWDIEETISKVDTNYFRSQDLSFYNLIPR